MGLYFLDVNCGGEATLKIIKFVFKLLTIAKFIVPMILVLFVMIDLFKNTVAGQEKDMPKNVNLAVKRIIFAIAIFLVEPIVKTSINLLGDIGVDYANCIELAIENDDLSPYRISLENSIIGDQIVIPDSLLRKNINKKPVNGGSSSSKNNVDASIKENIAALIAMEQGCNSEKVYLKYITTAIFVNNYAGHNGGSVEFTKEGMTKTIVSNTYTPDGLYDKLTFDKVTAYRGKISQEDRDRCLKIVDDVLDRKFTIPKNVVFAAAPYIVTTYGTIWGQETLTGGTWPVAVGYSGTIETTDVYGTEVTGDWKETVKKAEKLYK